MSIPVEHIFESLRKGLVPERGIDTFAEGVDLARSELHRQLELAAKGDGTIKFLMQAGETAYIAAQPIGTDARIVASAPGKPRVTIIVAGETARAQNFGLNGYARNTTPELAARDVINYSNASS